MVDLETINKRSRATTWNDLLEKEIPTVLAPSTPIRQVRLTRFFLSDLVRPQLKVTTEILHRLLLGTIVDINRSIVPLRL